MADDEEHASAALRHGAAVIVADQPQLAEGTASMREALRCREKRKRQRERERRLREEVEVLTFYRAVVENGPDLFSLHRGNIEAPFSFLCDDFYQRLRLTPEDVLGRPLASIIDPRDVCSLRSAVSHALNQDPVGGSGAVGSGGTLVHLRIACGGLSCRASMTLTIGTQGLIVVTRLYDM